MSVDMSSVLDGISGERVLASRTRSRKRGSRGSDSESRLMSLKRCSCGGLAGRGGRGRLWITSMLSVNGVGAEAGCLQAGARMCRMIMSGLCLMMSGAKFPVATTNTTDLYTALGLPSPSRPNMASAALQPFMKRCEMNIRPENLARVEPVSPGWCTGIMSRWLVTITPSCSWCAWRGLRRAGGAPYAPGTSCHLLVPC